MNRYLNNQYCKFFILLGFLISITYSIFITNKYDQNYLTQDKNKIEHYLIKGDVEDYFNIAFNFNNDLKKKAFFILEVNTRQVICTQKLFPFFL